MIKAIVFDYDGVLVASDIPRFKALKKAAAKYSYHIDDSLFNTLIGRTTKYFLNTFLKDKVLIKKITDSYEKEYKANIEKYVLPINLSVDFVRSYNGPYKLALATASSRDVITKLLKHIGIYVKFTLFICKDDVKNHKPDPEVYIITAKKLKILPDECIVIEDTVVGAKAAIAAHMKCFILLNGINKRSDFEGLEINGFISSKEDFENL